MLLGLDGGLDDNGVEGVGDQRDDQVVLADLVNERVRVGDVEGDGAGVLEALGESFGAVESTAGWKIVLACVLDMIVRGEIRHGYSGSPSMLPHLPTVTLTPALSSSTAVGLVTKPAPRRRTFPAAMIDVYVGD